MKFSAGFLLLTSLATAAAYPRAHTGAEVYTYSDYLSEFHKSYEADEYAEREVIFNANIADIKEHNNKAGVPFKKGINEVSPAASAEDDEMRTPTKPYRLPDAFFSKQQWDDSLSKFDN